MGRATRSRQAIAGLALGLAAAVMSDTASAQENSQPVPAPVRIGVVGSLFRDMPEPLVKVVTQPLGALMEAQMGMAGQLMIGGDALTLGQQLADAKLHLAVFHGIEFAWARQIHPELRPLMIAVNQQRHLCAYLVVRTDGASGLPGLKGKDLALPQGTREHCRLFLERHCKGSGQEPAQFFAHITSPGNFEDALDDVVDGEVQAAVVDGVALECFKRRKPGRYARLKPILESEIFPAAVIAYYPGVLQEDILRRFREGMINAQKSAMGRQLMTMWKLTAFEPVPADYEETLTNIVKSYPVPTSQK